MKKLYFLFLPLLVLSGNLNAQTSQSAEKKVYKSEDEKLYVNKDLGVYLWLSTSPDPKSKKILLESDSAEIYTNPMYLDTEGYNTVRSPSAVDPKTKKTIYPVQDIIFEVYADGLPPVSRSRYSYSGTKIIEGKRYYAGDIKIELSSTDKVSGVESIYYSFNSETFSAYKEAISNAKEGENNLKYYSIDKVGNQEEPKEEIFYLDKTPPKTVYEIQGEQNEKYISANSKIKLSSKDELSGLKVIYYKVDNGKFIRYSSPIPVSLLSNEKASISFYAEDLLGNKEAIQSIGSSDGLQVEGEKSSKDVVYEFYVDREPPEVKIEIEVVGDLHKAKYSYVSPRTKFKITANDTKAGVKEVKYSINSNLLNNEYKAPFDLEKEGLQYIHATASDYVGNTSAPIVKPFFNDPNPPVSSLKISSPKFSSRDTLFVSSKTKFSLNATDDHSGVKSIQYSIDSDETQIYKKDFTIQKSGLISLNYLASDNVGNKELNKKQVMFVDNDPPKIHYHYSVESIGSKVVREDTYTIYPTNVMLYIAATDSRSGGGKIEYSINGGSLLSANPIKGLSPNNYLIEVLAYDVLGNKSKEIIKFAIEE